MLKRANHWLGALLVAVILIVALLVAGLRLAMPLLAQHKAQVETWLSTRVGMPVQIAQLNAHWDQLYPRLQIQGLRVGSPSLPQFTIANIQAELDIGASLYHRLPVFAHLQMQQLDARVVMTEPQSATSGAVPARLLHWLVRQPNANIEHVRLALISPQGEHLLSIPELALRNTRHQHQLSGQGQLQTGAGQPTALQFAIEADVLPAEPSQGHYRIYLKLDELGAPLLALLDLPVALDELAMSGEVWGTLSAARLQHLQGRIQLHQLQVAGYPQLALQNSGWEFALTGTTPEHYQLLLANIALNTKLSPLAIEQAHADIHWSEGRGALTHLAVNRLDLATITGWLNTRPYFGEDLKAALAQLQPTGELEHINLTWPAPGEWANIVLEADLNQVNVADYHGAPALSGVDGRLFLTPDQGWIDLDSNHFGMGFPELFTSPWQYQQARGRIHWEVTDVAQHRHPVVRIHSDLLHLHNAQLQATGRFGLYLPIDRRYQTDLSLLISLQRADARHAKDYLPQPIIGAKLSQYIEQAVEQGQITQAMLLLRSATRSEAPDTGQNTAQLYVEVENARIKYQPDWPALENSQLALLVDNGALAIHSRQATLLNSSAAEIGVYLPAEGEMLQVRGQLNGPAEDIQAILTGPLQAQTSAQLADWRLTGRHHTWLDLRLPMQGEGAAEVTVQSRLQDGQINHQQLPLVFTHLDSQISYSSHTGLQAKNIRGRWNGQPLTGALTTPAQGPAKLVLAASSPLEPLQSFLPDWLGTRLAGNVGLSARLDLCPGSCAQLVLESDLQGVAISAPPPLGKSAEQRSWFQLVLNPTDQGTLLRYNLANQLRGVTRLGEQSSSDILLGGERPELTQQPGIRLSGRLADVSLEQWQALLPQSSSDNLLTNLPALDIDLHIGQLSWQDYRLGTWRLNLNRTRQGQLRAVIDSALARGTLTQQADQPYQLDLAYLRLPGNLQVPAIQERAHNLAPATPAFSPNSGGVTNWPPIRLGIAALYWQDQALGSWSAHINQREGGLILEQLRGKLADFSLSGQAGWRLQQQPVSFFQANLHGGDFGALLQQLGYSRVLEANESQFNIDLNWPGYPWQYQAGQLSGEFFMLLKKGRLIETGQGSNILRLFGILNLNTLARRLRLNFSDLVEKGVAFDRLQADYRLSNGVARTQTPLNLQGPSVDLNLTGMLDLGQQTLDSQLDVILPVTDNLPIAAVLLGAPQVAGAVFLIDKLVGDKLQKVSTLRYHLSGPWDDPAVQVEQPATDPTRKEQPYWPTGERS